MTGRPFTVGALEDLFRFALRAGDPKGAVAALTAMAPQDPHRAAALLNTTQAVLAAAGDVGQVAPASTLGKLYITCGLPGSGKTTLARAWRDEQPARRARSNRDDKRRSIFGGRTGKPEHEDIITTVQHTEIRTLLLAGFDTVVDDTNLVPETSQALIGIADLLGAEVEVWDLTYLGVQTCIDRDVSRAVLGGRSVGEEVIRQMHREWLDRRIRALRDEAEQALLDMRDRYDQMSRDSIDRWPDGDPITVTVDHANQVLTDPDLRGRIEELAEGGRRAHVVIDLVDVVAGLPGADDLGGSTVLAQILGAGGSRNVRYQRTTVPNPTDERTTR